MSHNASLLLYTLLAVVGLVILVTACKLNAFIALTLASIFVGLCSGMNLPDIAKSFQEGMGNVLGSIAAVVGLGTILGKLLAESGGAEVVARTLVNALGEKRLPWTMLLIGFIVGIPTWFSVGLVLLIPIVFTIAKETRTPLLQLGLPLVAGLSVAHGLIPPHPGPMAAIGVLNADTGKIILYSLLIGFPTAVVAGPIWSKFISPRVPVELSGIGAQLTHSSASKTKPGFALTLFTILLPVLLMLAATAADVIWPANKDLFDVFVVSYDSDKKDQIAKAYRTVMSEFSGTQTTSKEAYDPVATPPYRLLELAPKPVADSMKSRLEAAGARVNMRGNPIRETADFIGSPLVAMLAAVFFALWSFGYARGFDKVRLLKFTDECLGPVALVLLIVGGGGGFSKVLNNSGVGNAIGELAKTAPVSPLVLGWLVAALIRVATGSATVAITTAAGILAPLAASMPGLNRELFVLAMGAGSMVLSHVNDGGFWFVKEYLNLTVPQTFKTWTVMETIMSVVALMLVLLLNALL